MRIILERLTVIAIILCTILTTGAIAAERIGLQAITVPEGFTVELVAAPPLVERPMLACFDDRGRLYVGDSAGVNLRGPELTKNPPHVIRVLEDLDGDGRFEKSSVFADKLIFPQGIAWHDGSIFCSSPPSFWKLTDTDGDGAADRREELVTGFANTGVADDMHGGSLGPDGRVYWCAGRFPHRIHRPDGPMIHVGTAPLILRCRPDGSDLEVVCGSQGNAVGVAFTPEGDMFASGTFLAPNSMGAGLRDALIHCVDGGEYPVRDRVLNEHKRTGDLLPPMTHLGVSAASDLMIARSDGLGDGYRGNLFSAQFNLHKILRHKLEQTGATYACRNEDFLASSDPDFHPTDVLEDADGSLLVLDTGAWFRIGCPTSQVAKPEVLGGIYRVRKKDATGVSDPRGMAIAWQQLSADELAKLLGDPRFAVRDRAIAALVNLGAAAVPALTGVLAADSTTDTKCTAVWALCRIDAQEARSATRKALDDKTPGVRQAAVRAAGLHRDHQAAQRLAALVTSDAPAVRREAATALGRMGQSSAVPALLGALDTPSDRFLEHAVIFALIRIGDRALTAKGLETASTPAKRAALVALDQMDDGNLTPRMVTGFLSAGEPLLQQTALWVIAHHGDWGPSMVDFFREWLTRDQMDDSQRNELKRQLLAFVNDATVQELVGGALANPRTPTATRLVLLEAIAQAPLGTMPAAWVEPLRQALNDADEVVVRQAVATLRALPLDKRPLVSRVDRQIDFPATDKRFAGTKLSENFCVRWTGVLRCPKDANYTFTTESDDGSELFIDGARVVDNSGSHAMRERSGQVKLADGDHALRLDFVQGEGEAGCKLSWAFEGCAKQIVPPGALFHRPAGGGADAALEPGLSAEFFALDGNGEKFPDLVASRFDAALLNLAMDTARPPDVRVPAAAAVMPRLPAVEPPLFEFLISAVREVNPPLVRLDAADALGKSRLDTRQLKGLTVAIAAGGVLEVPRLLPAFEQSSDDEVGRMLVAALGNSPGRRSISSAALASVLASYGESVRTAAEPLSRSIGIDKQKQMARLAELDDVLTSGEIQRGRDLFFANQKAICATCHAVQGQGGQFGPELSKIGAIRAPRDLLEAIVFPSASFARGYEPFNVVTRDGQVVSGIIARETADAIYLVGNSRVEVRLARSDIESIEQANISIMPEGMDNQLTRQELADLLAFLQSLR